MLFGPSIFVCNWSNLSDSGALWPGMKPESGLIQTPSTSQHSVLTCTTGLTTSQPSPAHYSYSVEGNLAWFLSASLSTSLSPDTTERLARLAWVGACFFMLCLFPLCACVCLVVPLLRTSVCARLAWWCHADGLNRARSKREGERRPSVVFLHAFTGNALAAQALCWWSLA